MLHTKTVSGDTLGLLKGLMALPELSSFALVGGTNLSLRFGHRLSVDLDLFTNQSFSPLSVYDTILDSFPNSQLASHGTLSRFMLQQFALHTLSSVLDTKSLSH